VPHSDGTLFILHSRCQTRRLSCPALVDLPLTQLIVATSNVRLWHLADTDPRATHVRFGGQSGHRKSARRWSWRLV
jgi:hypothetical protein